MTGTEAENEPRKKHASLIRSLSTVASLIRPHWRPLLFSAVLIVLSQLTRLVLPYSSKYLMDTVVLKHQPSKLLPLIALVFTAILIHASEVFVVSLILA